MSNTTFKKVLAVDLDGSLIKTDMLYETFIKLLYSKPWLLLCVPLWLVHGKGYLKQKLYEASDIDVSDLPWNQSLLDYLQKQHGEGREIILCTGSWWQLAEKIATQFPFFSAVYGTNSDGNLTGSRKAKLLCKHYGDKGFSYVGNEKRDLKIWSHADSAVVVNSSNRLGDRVKAICNIEKTIITSRPTLNVLLKQMRVHQWVKNALVFVALITSHQTTDIPLLVNTIIAFFAYSLCASATYILNDLSDLESDRRHDKKRFRPLASGDLSIPGGLLLAIALFFGAFILAAQLPVWFILSLLLYILITLSYSFKLKRLQTLDIVVLASLYTLRIISGALAISVIPSFWLLAFSMFVFLCLAIVKRLSEILKNKEEKNDSYKLSGRGYYVGDYPVLLNLATGAGMMSILVFAMYINSPEVITLYSEPYALWLICPLFGYWIIRIIIMASRGQIDEDPIVFAIKDRRSWITGAIILCVVVFSSAAVIH